MSEILIIYAHPNESKSSATGPIVGDLARREGVTVRRLYDLHPDFFVNVDAEQKALEHADHVVLAFPFYWYSVPALLKEWIDAVLVLGWAYGDGGRALNGKTMTLLVSSGGNAKQYTPEGGHGAEFDDLLLPLKRSFALCQMNWQEPIWLPGASDVDRTQSLAWLSEVHRRLDLLVEGERS